LLDRTRAGQTARLNFGLAPDVERPELIKGKIPSNPDQPGDASLRVRFTVGPDGRPKNFQTFETNNREWTDGALHEMAGWRFRPAMRAGRPEEVNGLFELTVSQPQPLGNFPTLRRSLVTILPPEPQDSSMPAPNPISPPDHALLDGYPRHLTCKWEASPGAVVYLLEWDYMNQDAWHAESLGIPGTADEVNATENSVRLCGSPARPLARLAGERQRPARQAE
jgi:hypothetical protein